MWAIIWLTVLATYFVIVSPIGGISALPGSSSSFLLPSPTPSSIPQDSQGSSIGLLWLWILLGVLAGSFLLGLLIFLVILVVATARKKRRVYTFNSNGQSVHKHSINASGVSQIKTRKYHRSVSTTTDRSTSINSHSHVTIGRTESGQHKHMQVVNKGYLLASNEAHQNDGVATHDQKQSQKLKVALLPKLRENEGEEYDSDYSEVAITTNAANNTSQVRETEGSLGISIHQNIAYELDEDAIATVNSLRQTAVFGSPIKSGGGVPPPQAKKPPAVKVKPKKRMTSSSSSNFEASILYDAPKSNRPLCLEDSVIDSVYDMVRSEYGEEVETALTDHEDIPQPRQQSNDSQYTNISGSVQGSARERSGGYYNQRDLELMKHAEVLYANLKENSVPDYVNLKKESNTGEAFYGNLNQDTEENEYYNQRETMESSR